MAPFINLPSRNLREYYRVIKHPVSLKIVQRAVQGVKGRDKPTGISNFKSWATFEEEASCIWKNAYHYNEDGSDISEAARVLEVSWTLFPKWKHADADVRITSTVDSQKPKRLYLNLPRPK